MAGFIEAFGQSSLRPISVIINSERKCLKLFWSSILAVSLTVTVAFLIQSLVLFFNYPIGITVKIDSDPLEFPSVSVCSLNPYKLSTIKEKAPKLHEAISDYSRTVVKKMENSGRSKRDVDDVLAHDEKINGNVSTQAPEPLETKIRRPRQTPATAPDHVGQIFYTSFLPDYASSAAYRSNYLYLTTASTTPFVVTVTTKGPTSGSTTIPIDNTKVYRVNLPTDPIMGVKLTGAYDFAVYAYHTGDDSSDAVLVPPLDTLGTDYAVLDLFQVNSYAKKSLVYIVPTATGTSVTVHFLNGTQATFTRNELDVIYLEFGEEASGTRITSNYPIAVLAGHDCMYYPDTGCTGCDIVFEHAVWRIFDVDDGQVTMWPTGAYTLKDREGGCATDLAINHRYRRSTKQPLVITDDYCYNALITRDHMPPTNTNGLQYALVPFKHSSSTVGNCCNNKTLYANYYDFFKVLALYDGTTITRTGRAPFSMSKNTVIDVLVLVTEFSLLKSNYPIMVMHIMQSNDYNGNGWEEPAMYLVPPTDAWVNSYEIPSCNPSFGPTHYINVVIPTAKALGLLMNGNPFLGSTTAHPIAGTLLSAYLYTISCPAPAALIKLHHPDVSVLFMVVAYGYGAGDLSYVTTNSYTFLGGRLFVPSSFFCTPTADGNPPDVLDNDCDGWVDEELRNFIDDDGDGRIDEDLAAMIPLLTVIDSQVTSCNTTVAPPPINGSEPQFAQATVDTRCSPPKNLTYTDSATAPSCPTVINRTWSLIDACGNIADKVSQLITIYKTPDNYTAPPTAFVSDPTLLLNASATGIPTVVSGCAGAPPDAWNFTFADATLNDTAINRTFTINTACMMTGIQVWQLIIMDATTTTSTTTTSTTTVATTTMLTTTVPTTVFTTTVPTTVLTTTVPTTEQTTTAATTISTTTVPITVLTTTVPTTEQTTTAATTISTTTVPITVLTTTVPTTILTTTAETTTLTTSTESATIATTTVSTSTPVPTTTMPTSTDVTTTVPTTTDSTTSTSAETSSTVPTSIQTSTVPTSAPTTTIQSTSGAMTTTEISTLPSTSTMSSSTIASSSYVVSSTVQTTTESITSPSSASPSIITQESSSTTMQMSTSMAMTSTNQLTSPMIIETTSMPTTDSTVSSTLSTAVTQTSASTSTVMMSTPMTSAVTSSAAESSPTTADAMTSSTPLSSSSLNSSPESSSTVIPDSSIVTSAITQLDSTVPLTSTIGPDTSLASSTFVPISSSVDTTTSSPSPTSTLDSSSDVTSSTVRIVAKTKPITNSISVASFDQSTSTSAISVDQSTIVSTDSFDQSTSISTIETSSVTVITENLVSSATSDLLSSDTVSSSFQPESSLSTSTPGTSTVPKVAAKTKPPTTGIVIYSTVASSESGTTPLSGLSTSEQSVSISSLSSESATVPTSSTHRIVAKTKASTVGILINALDPTTETVDQSSQQTTDISASDYTSPEANQISIDPLISETMASLQPGDMTAANVDALTAISAIPYGSTDAFATTDPLQTDTEIGLMNAVQAAPGSDSVTVDEAPLSETGGPDPDTAIPTNFATDPAVSATDGTDLSNSIIDPTADQQLATADSAAANPFANSDSNTDSILPDNLQSPDSQSTASEGNSPMPILIPPLDNADSITASLNELPNSNPYPTADSNLQETLQPSDQYLGDSTDNPLATDANPILAGSVDPNGDTENAVDENSADPGVISPADNLQPAQNVDNPDSDSIPKSGSIFDTLFPDGLVPNPDATIENLSSSPDPSGMNLAQSESPDLPINNADSNDLSTGRSTKQQYRRSMKPNFQSPIEQGNQDSPLATEAISQSSIADSDQMNSPNGQSQLPNQNSQSIMGPVTDLANNISTGNAQDQDTPNSNDEFPTAPPNLGVNPVPDNDHAQSDTSDPDDFPVSSASVDSNSSDKPKQMSLGSLLDPNTGSSVTMSLVTGMPNKPNPMDNPIITPASLSDMPDSPKLNDSSRKLTTDNNNQPASLATPLKNTNGDNNPSNSNIDNAPDPTPSESDPSNDANPDQQYINPDPKNVNPNPKNGNPDPKNVNPDPKNINPDPKNVNPDPKNANPDRSNDVSPGPKSGIDPSSNDPIQPNGNPGNDNRPDSNPINGDPNQPNSNNDPSGNNDPSKNNEINNVPDVPSSQSNPNSVANTDPKSDTNPDKNPGKSDNPNQPSGNPKDGNNPSSNPNDADPGNSNDPSKNHEVGNLPVKPPSQSDPKIDANTDPKKDKNPDKNPSNNNDPSQPSGNPKGSNSPSGNPNDPGNDPNKPSDNPKGRNNPGSNPNAPGSDPSDDPNKSSDSPKNANNPGSNPNAPGSDPSNSDDPNQSSDNPKKGDNPGSNPNVPGSDPSDDPNKSSDSPKNANNPGSNPNAPGSDPSNSDDPNQSSNNPKKGDNPGSNPNNADPSQPNGNSDPSKDQSGPNPNGSPKGDNQSPNNANPNGQAQNPENGNSPNTQTNMDKPKPNPEVSSSLSIPTPSDVDSLLPWASEMQDALPYLVKSNVFNESILRELGYQMNEFVFWCRYAGRPCVRDQELQMYTDPNYGNCFTFNALPNTHYSRRGGLRLGLRMIFNTPSSDYLPFSLSAGYKIILHNPNENPVMAMAGTTCSSGQYYTFSASRYQLESAGEPYQSCDTNTTTKGQFFYTNKSYSVDACLGSCYQQMVLDLCGCGDPHYPVPKGKPCVDNASSKAADYISVTTCHCEPPCSNVMFNAEQTKASWPSKIFSPPKCKGLKGVELDECKEKFKNTYSRLDVYYGVMTSRTMEGYAQYTVLQLTADLFSNFGLWLNLCIISLFELVVIPAGVILEKMKRK